MRSIFNFSPDEQLLLTVLDAADQPLAALQLATACFPNGKVLGDLEPKGKRWEHGRGVSSYRRVLNGVRRLIRYGYAARSGRGFYAVTDRGRGAA